MSKLQDRLDRMREGFHKQAPESVTTVMRRATDDLRESGIVSRIPAVGDTLPDFELPDTDSTPVRSADLRADGPLVVTFYRGWW